MPCNFDELIALVETGAKTKVAVAAAEDMDAIAVSLRCAEFADFIFIGDAKKIERLFAEAGEKINGEIIDMPNHADAAAKAVEAVKTGKAHNLMKGLLPSSVFLKAILDKETGFNTGKLISQITVFEKPNAPGFIFLTDCAITIAPGFAEKKQILENAVELARAMGVETPKAALLAAAETVNPAMQATVDAAMLTTMAKRGQIRNCIVDGPLALDNALDADAARLKGIGGPVAGRADILVAPNIEAGNMLGKALVYLANKRTAAALAGAGIPVIFTSRSETPENKALTVTLSAYLAQRRILR